MQMSSERPNTGSACSNSIRSVVSASCSQLRKQPPYLYLHLLARDYFPTAPTRRQTSAYLFLLTGRLFKKLSWRK
ncbi:hypothetical protein T07_6274 [Trichinella nelsoni]|uniref:Uncharacterized protein n=1 Tax=Trichinella nelsoni TaxID=6336 RepID=A0A0V0SIB5_9BILA|nr:hypothetical protein T07_6274 [Trichinella nelsoni]